MENRAPLCRRVFIVLLLFMHSISAAVSQQTGRGVTASNGVFIGFYEYKPVDYNIDPSLKYPLIIFLHGIGERGNGTSELPNLLNIALPKYINQGHPMRFFWNGKWETFLVLSPQLSVNYGDWQNFYVDEMLKYAKNNLRVDTNRIFLTGLSLGGGGTWAYAGASLANAQKFAAIAPVCGVCQGGINWCNFSNAKLPVWAFHALDDNIVGAGCTHSAITNIENCNPAVKPIKTIWPDGNHWIWDRAYDTVYNWQNPNLFEWFLGQNKSLPVNILPVANAGADMSITTATGSVSLNGNASTDADGNIVRYLWKKISGPSGGSIVSAGASATTVSGLTNAGTYQFELTVVDNRTGWTKDVVDVVVTNGPPAPPGNQAPVANAGADITLLLPSNSSSLNGSSSADADGFITTWQWNKVSGPSNWNLGNSTAAITSLNNLIEGTYQFRLVVTDNAGATDEDFVNITVISPNIPPIALAGGDVQITLPVSSVTLNGSSSYDPDGSINNYQWSKISGPAQFTLTNANAASTTVANLTQGLYTFELKVWDNYWIPRADTVVIQVNAPPPPAINQPPVANAGNDVTITLPTNAITLNASASADPDGSVTGYQWSLISGPPTYVIATPTDMSTVVYNFGAGIYTFRLYITDNSGLSDSDTIVITINNAPPPPPVANIPPVARAGNDVTLTLPVNNTVLNGSSSADADGNISLYSWSRISGPVQYFVTSPNAVSTGLQNLIQGVYVFRLEVLDNHGVADDDTITVTVLPAVNQNPIARAGADITITLPVNYSTLNGSSSADPDGSINNYSWQKLSGPAAFHLGSPGNAWCGVSNLVEGTYTFRLQVTDNSGAMDDDTVSVLVRPTPNLPPVANAGKDTTAYLPNPSILLNGTLSADPDGSIASFNWVRVSGGGSITIINSTNSQATVTGLHAGVHVFRLTVTDNKGLTATDDVTVSIQSALNLAPVANAGTDTVIVVPSTTAVLSGALSFDLDGTIVKYKWKQLSGQNAVVISNDSMKVTEATHLEAGEFTFELAVTDNRGSVARDTVQIAVRNNYRYQENIQVYPNPASDFIVIRCASDTSGQAQIRIIDVNGNVVKNIMAEKFQAVFQQKIYVHELKNGIYFIEVLIDRKKQMLTRFIKR